MTPEEAYEEALRRIEHAAATNATKLVLYDLPLLQLPSEIGQCKNLEILLIGTPAPVGFAYAKLTTLPQSIGKLQYLRKLYVNENRLLSLPDSIGQLTSLQELNLRGNLLTHLPDTLCQLANLQSLDLLGNNLTTLPKNFGQLVSLKELDISRNKLITLP